MPATNCNTSRVQGCDPQQYDVWSLRTRYHLPWGFWKQTPSILVIPLFLPPTMSNQSPEPIGSILKYLLNLPVPPHCHYHYPSSSCHHLLLQSVLLWSIPVLLPVQSQGHPEWSFRNANVSHFQAYTPAMYGLLTPLIPAPGPVPNTQRCFEVIVDWLTDGIQLLLCGSLTRKVKDLNDSYHFFMRQNCMRTVKYYLPCLSITSSCTYQWGKLEGWRRKSFHMEHAELSLVL